MNSQNEKTVKNFLLELTDKLGATIIGGLTDAVISDVTSDSRNAGSGKIFVAIKGVTTDGHKFIADAEKKGVSAVVVQQDEELPMLSIPIAIVKDSREALVILLHKLLGNPPDKLFAVTGTNGKTTTTHILRHIFTRAGEKAGIIGTLGYAFEDGEHNKLPVTTPGAEQLWRILAQMRNRSISAVAMEVSSHGLDQKRTWGLDFNVAIFTNLTQDHLDYHKDMESYLAAKCMLFSGLRKTSIALVNIDDPYAERIIAENRGTLLTYAIDNTKADIVAEPKSIGISGSRLALRTPWGRFDVHTHLQGRFNIYNVTAAIGATMARGYAPDAIISAIESFKSVKGRFQKVELGQPFAVLVDYAHTPEALRNILITAREMTDGKVIVVFGAGGDRDNSKRPLMGKAASELADIVIITSDNPRTEEPLKIIAMIEQGMHSDSNYKKIPDRREAIFEAIRSAEKGDVVLIAGKGHEDYQILGDETIHFDDVEIATEAIERILCKK